MNSAEKNCSVWTVGGNIFTARIVKKEELANFVKNCDELKKYKITSEDDFVPILQKLFPRE